WKEWHRRNRLPSPPPARWAHFKDLRQSMFLLPADKYGKSHPEYYPLVNGKRLVPEAKYPSPLAWNWQPCYSNEEVRHIYIAEALRFFDEHPEVPSYEMGLDDAEVFCQCDVCRALDGDVDAFAERNFSNRYYWFLKQVADGVAQTRPDRSIGTLVYAQTRTLPDNMDRLPDNVFAYLADTRTHAAEWWNKDVKNTEQAHRREWARRVGHLGRYEYYGLDWWMPRYYPHLLDEEIKFDRDLGFGSEYAEIYALRTHLAPMLWAVTRLYWDATLDMDDLLDTFFSGMFAEAAQPMKRYWEGLEDAWVNRDPSITGNGWRDLETQAKLFPPQRLDPLEACLKEAGERTQSDLVRQRINLFADALEFSAYIGRTCYLGRALAQAPITNEESARQALDQAFELDSLSRQRQRRWEEIKAGDDLTGQALRGMAAVTGSTLAQVTQFEAPMYAALDEALAWFRDNAPAKTAALVASFRQTHPDSGLVQILDAKEGIVSGSYANLLANGDFEKEPSSTGAAPVGWGRWQTEGCKGRFGSRRFKRSMVGEITGAKSAVFMQDINVAPGEVYYASARVRHLPRDGKGKVLLVAGLMDADGKWLDGQSNQFTTEDASSDGQWHMLHMLMRMPGRAGKLRLMCAAQGMAPDEAAQFDDVVLVRLPPSPE
ncbi:MAG: DUF4838 domain-containing protein, partial [Planctomycetota bacterium]